MQSTQITAQRQQMDPLTIALRCRRGLSVNHWHVSPHNAATPPAVRTQGGSEVYDMVRTLGTAWDSHDRGAMTKVCQDHRWDEFFDPATSEKALRQFAAYGGCDQLVRILMDNPHWLFDPVRDGGNRPFSIYRDPLGVHAIWLLCLKVLTEAIILDNDIGWVLFRKHRLLPLRLLMVLKCDLFYEPACTLLEHMISVVGPVLLVEEVEHAHREFSEGSDVNLASLFRPLALLCTPSAVSDSARRIELEPFPQCLTRMRKGEDNALRNVTSILLNRPLLGRLMKLIEYESHGIRIFQGNRTMTVMPNGSAQEGEGGEPQSQQQMTMQAFQQMLMEQAGNAAGGEGQDTQALIQAIQQAFGGGATPGSGGGGPSGPGGGAPSAPGEAVPQQSLQEMADSLQGDLPKQNQLDSANYGWFTGRPDGRIFWRLENPTINCRREALLVPSHRSKQEDEYFTKVKGIKVRTEAQQNQLDEQAIVNAQSEITYVLATFMMATCRETAWEAMMGLGTLNRLNSIFDSLFHPEGDKSYSLESDMDDFNNIAKRPVTEQMGDGVAAGGSGAPGGGSDGSSDDEDEENDGVGASPGREGSPSGAGGASKDASPPADAKQAKQKRKKRRVVPSGLGGGGNNNGDDSDASSTLDCEGIDTDEEDVAKEDDEAHNHNSDTLRKIEILRLSYELWSCSEALELERKLKFPEVQEQSFALAGKICELLMEARKAQKEAFETPGATAAAAAAAADNTIASHTKKKDEKLDPCLEAQGFHAIEGFLRGFGREARPVMQVKIAEKMLPTLCENLLTAFSPESKQKGAKNPLRPKKLMQAVLSVIGEMIRQNAQTTEMLESLIGAACHSGSVLGEEERKRNAFGEIILHYPEYSHFLLRGLVLTMYPSWRSAANMCCITGTPYILPPDRTTTVVCRVWNIKVIAHRFLQRVLTNGGDSVTIVEIVNACLQAHRTPGHVKDQPNAAAAADDDDEEEEEVESQKAGEDEDDAEAKARKQQHRSQQEKEWDADFNMRLYLPFADLPGTDSYNRLHRQDTIGGEDVCEEEAEQEEKDGEEKVATRKKQVLRFIDITPDVETHNELPYLAPVQAPNLTCFLREHRAEICFKVILACDLSGAENTESLAMMTTTMMLLKSAQDDHVAEMVDKKKKKSSVDDDDDVVHDLVLFDAIYQYEDTVWRPRRLRDLPKVDNDKNETQRLKIARYDSGKCFFKCLFLWLAHYSCAQKYIVTYHYCTDVSFNTISEFALYVLTCLKTRLSQPKHHE